MKRTSLNISRKPAYEVAPTNMHKALDKLEAKDVLPDINRTQATERAKNAAFVPGDLDL